MVEVLARHDPVPAARVRHAGLTIALAPPQTRYSLRTRHPRGLPTKLLQAAPYCDGSALCLGPDEWLLVLPEGSAAPAIEGMHALCDIGHRNIGIDIEGSGAWALIQSGCALDLARAFPPGKATRTLYEGVEIILWRIGDERFRIEVWRSFASYLWAALELAAGDMGDGTRLG
jgi:sarcosine oxidase subunit gamma